MTGEERRQAMLRQRGEHRRAENKAQEEQRLNKRRMILEQTQKRLKKQKRMKLLKKFGIPGVLAVILLVVLVLALKSCGEKNSGGNGGKGLPAAETGLSREAGTDDAEETTQAEELPALPGREEISVVRIPVEPPTAAPTTASVTQVYQVTAAPAPESEPAAAAQGPYQDPSGILVPSWITQAMIHVNPVSRPAIALDSVDYIVIHYVGNPGSTAMGNREYFDSLDNPAVEGAGRQASAQLIVGLEGEVIQCLPLNELAYATGNADLNRRTISIEVCHPDWEGKFSDVTYNSLVKLTAWLLQQEGLTPDRLLRHHDCSGKLCPRYYVEHPEAWEQLKADIAAYYYNHPNIQ